MTPEMLAKSGTEEAHQTAFFCELANMAQHNKLLHFCFAVPNGGKRDKVTAGKMKAAGVRAGVWDVFLPIPTMTHHGLWLEFKVKPNVLSDKQQEFGAVMFQLDYAIKVCYTWQEAIEAVKDYLLGRIV